MAAKAHSTFEPEILSQAVVESFKKLNPLNMARNPVMFVCEVGAAITTAGLIVKPEGETFGFGLQIAVWLWFTVLFANFAEAVAEGRGKAQANALTKDTANTDHGSPSLAGRFDRAGNLCGTTAKRRRGGRVRRGAHTRRRRSDRGRCFGG